MCAWNRSIGSKALPPHLGVEVDAARGESVLPEDDEHALRREINVGRELVRVPAEQHVARVGVDAAERSLNRRVDQLVHHRVAGERGVIRLDVEFHVLLEIVLPDEIQARRRVEVVLVLGRLLRFGLEQELPGKADRLGEVDRHVHEPREVIQLALHVGVVEVLSTPRARPRRRNCCPPIPASRQSPASPGPPRRQRRRHSGWSPPRACTAGAKRGLPSPTGA